jgi:nucleotidyltransferase substrate binding protein (TIGR01987 family)
MEWFDDEKLWLKMLHDRNFMSHNYEQETADDVYARIKTYYPEMKVVYEKLKGLSEGLDE